MSRQQDLRSRLGWARSWSARATCGRAAAALALTLFALVPASAVTGRHGTRALAPKSDMFITVAASPGFASGFNATYTLSVNNNGPQAAPGPITVTDTLPVGLTYSSGTGAGWTCGVTGQVVTCTTPGPFVKNVVQTITIVAAITSAVATSVTNIVRVIDGANDDLDLTNNRATVTSAVTVRTVATTPDAATTSQLPSNGINYTQTFVLTNTGNISDSYNLVATVAPAAGVVTIVSVNGGITPTTVVAAAGTLNVNVIYSVNAGAATGATAKITLTATSIVTGTSADAGDVTVTVARAGVTMSKQLYRDNRTTLITGPAAVSTGEYVQYKVTITNGGSASASSLIVTDPIPVAVTYDSATPDAAGWTITTAAGTLTGTLAGTLAVGASRFFWIRVRVK